MPFLMTQNGFYSYTAKQQSSVILMELIRLENEPFPALEYFKPKSELELWFLSLRKFLEWGDFMHITLISSKNGSL